jgi:hypothetical protein
VGAHMISMLQDVEHGRGTLAAQGGKLEVTQA